MEKIKPGRKRELSDEERKVRAAARARRWRQKHPKSWEEIQKRSYEKKKARRAQQKPGVEVELVIP
jgi:hypothetical protein